MKNYVLYMKLHVILHSDFACKSARNITIKNKGNGK